MIIMGILAAVLLLALGIGVWGLAVPFRLFHARGAAAEGFLATSQLATTAPAGILKWRPLSVVDQLLKPCPEACGKVDSVCNVYTQSRSPW